MFIATRAEQAQARSRSRTRRNSDANSVNPALTPSAHRIRSYDNKDNNGNNKTSPALSTSPNARRISNEHDFNISNDNNDTTVNINVTSDDNSNDNQSTSDSVAERLRRVEEMSKRRIDVQREMSNINIQLEREDSYWTQQQDKFNKLVERTEVGSLTSKELYKYLIKTNKLYSVVHEYIDSIELFGTLENGTLANACASYDVLRKTTQQYIYDTKNKSLSGLLKKANDLSRTMSYRSESFEDSGRKLFKQIRSDRQHMYDSWHNYVNAIDYRNNREQNDKPIQPNKDPYLLCRAYDKEQTLLKATENKYRREMTQMYNDVIVEDKQRIEQIKSILVSQLTNQKNLLNNLLQHTETTLSIVNQINSDNDINEFIQQNGLTVHGSEVVNQQQKPANTGSNTATTTAATTTSVSSITATPTTSTSAPTPVTTTSSTVPVFEMPPPIRDPHMLLRLYSYELDREGPLYRQGKIIRSSWKLVHAAISRNGLFHYGEADDIKGPADVSIQLSDCHVMLKNIKDVSGFEIIQPSNNSWLLPLASSPNVYYFKAATPQLAQEWVQALQKYTKPAPTTNNVSSNKSNDKTDESKEQTNNDNSIATTESKSNDDNNNDESKTSDHDTSNESFVDVVHDQTVNESSIAQTQTIDNELLDETLNEEKTQD